MKSSTNGREGMLGSYIGGKARRCRIFVGWSDGKRPLRRRK